MRLTLRFFAGARDAAGQAQMSLEVAEGATARDLLALLQEQYPELEGIAPSLLIAVNHEFVSPETPLRDRDEVALLPPVSGGGQGTMLEITDEPLEVKAVEAAVAADSMGAIVTFVGVVRGHSRGKKVLYLEYEAYKEMAEKKLAEVGQEVAARWPETRMAVRHRVGHLEVGEAAVVIAVGAAHRREAFAACEYAIDRIKQIVPVWKKEVWEDGATWVGLESDTPRTTL